MSKNITVMQNKESQSFNGVKKIQTNLVDDKTQYWVPEDEAADYIKTKKLSVSENGRYSIDDENDGDSSYKIDAYSEVRVKVPDERYRTIKKRITKNGSYNAAEDQADAYSGVTVNVEGGVSSGDYTFKWEEVSNQGHGQREAFVNTVQLIECGGTIYMFLKNIPQFKSFNGTSWSTLPDLPGPSGTRIAGAYNNQLHVFVDLRHYIWNGSTWESSISAPRLCTSDSHIIESQGKLHYFCAYGANPGYFTFNGTSWSGKNNREVYNYRGTTAMYEYDGVIHYNWGKKDYIWTGDTFEDTGLSWEGALYSVGSTSVNNNQKIVGISDNYSSYSVNNVYTPKSYNGLFIRPEEIHEMTNSSYLSLRSQISSIDGTLYCITGNKTFKATLIT